MTVVTSSRGKNLGHYRERVGLIDVIRFPEKYHVFEAPIVPRIAAAALNMDYDVLHVNGMAPGITDLAILFAKLRRKPVVVTYHNDAETHIWGLLGRLATVAYAVFARLALRFANVVVCSTSSYASTSRVLRYLGEKVRIIPLGVDMDPFKGASTQLASDPKKLLFVGQLKQYKGVHVLLESMAQLKQQGHKVMLDVVGTGPESERLGTMVKDLDLHGHVTFRGNVEDKDLPGIYASCNTFVLPSLNRREAFGLVLLEALAAGKPIVASDVPGVSEVVSRAGGYLSKPNDSASLTSSILKALNSDEGADKYRGAASKLSWDAAAQSYESVFSSLVSAV